MHEKLQDLFERWQVAGGEDKYFLTLKMHTLIFESITKRVLLPSPKLRKEIQKFGTGLQNGTLKEEWMETFIKHIVEEAKQ